MKKAKNLRTKSFLYFLGTACIAIAIIWIAKYVFLDTIYQSKKSAEIEDNVSQIVNIYENYEHPNEAIQQIAIKNNYDVIIFKIDNNIGKIIFDNSSFYDTEKINTALNKMLDSLGTSTQTVYVTQNFENIDTLTIGRRTIINNETIYFYVSTPAQVLVAERTATTTWLLIASIAILSVCVLVAFFASSKISAPLTELKNKISINKENNTPIEMSFNTYEEIQDIELALATTEPVASSDAPASLNILNCVNDEIKQMTAKLYETSAELKKAKTLSKKTANGLQEIISQSAKIENFVEDLLESQHLSLNRVQFEFNKFDLSASLTELCEQILPVLPSSVTDFSKTIAKNVTLLADKDKFMYAIKCTIFAFAEDIATQQIKLRLAKVPASENYKLTIKTEKNPKWLASSENTEQKNNNIVSLKLHILQQVLEKHQFEYSLDQQNNTLAITFAGTKEQKIKTTNDEA